MALFNIFGKRDVSKDIGKRSPFMVATEWMPYKLYAGKKSSSNLSIKVRNLTKEVLLTSLVVELPPKLGFDGMGLSKEREIRLGEIAPGEEKEAGIGVYNGLDADSGEYTLMLTAIAHYRDYGHVINAVRKRVDVEVV